MSSFSRLFQSLVSLALPDNDQAQSEEAAETSEENTEEPFQPVVANVLAVKGYLLEKLPLELVDTIIDLAEYWPHTHIAVRQTSARDSQRIIAGSNEDEFILRSYPLGYIPKENNPTDHSFRTKGFSTSPPIPGTNCDECSEEFMKKALLQWEKESHVRGEFPCRKIVFTITSRDQGWGGHPDCRGTYKNSYTWFDVGKEEACIFEKVRQTPPGQSAYNTSSIAGISEVVTGTFYNPYFIVNPSLASENKSSEFTDANIVVCTSRTISPTTDSAIITSSLSDRSPIKNHKFYHPLLPDSTALQKNVLAERNVRKHVITWSFDDDIDSESTAADDLEDKGRGRATANGEYVRSLRPGQIVTVWGKARFGGWINYVEEVMIDIYWAV